jgi:aconitate hydratase
MVAAGLLARNAHARGLKTKPWVKTSLAPGSKVVTDYLEKSGLIDDLAALGFFTVGYGCTTCIGNSGPLKPEIEAAIKAGDIVGTSVLSGNRNFEGRIHALVRMNFLASPPLVVARMNFLASPPLVVAYALAGNLDVNLFNDPLGSDADGNPVYLRDIWPDQQEIHAAITSNIDSEMFKSSYRGVFAGDSNWNAISSPEGEIYTWDDSSTYVKNPPYFEGMTLEPAPVSDIHGARVLALLGDSVTTDHISPAGGIAADSPAAEYLEAHGVARPDFNSYGSRRGNHEVMMRGTFANIRLRNRLAPGTEGGWTRHQPSGSQMSIYDASLAYKQEGTPLIVLAGSEYGTGSSRDWAAKGTLLLGVKAVIAKSFERIHRSNLIGMGVLPLQFVDGQDAETLGLTGTEVYDIAGHTDPDAKTVTVTATPTDGDAVVFEAEVRIDTPKERDYFEHGGILHYVLRQLAA